MKHTIEITLELNMPDELVYNELTLRRWIEFHVSSWGGIPVDDPLCEQDPTEFLEDIHVEIRD